MSEIPSLISDLAVILVSAGFIASCAGLAVAYGVGAGCCLASLGVYLRWVRPSYEKYKLLV